MQGTSVRRYGGSDKFRPELRAGTRGRLPAGCMGRRFAPIGVAFSKAVAQADGLAALSRVCVHAKKKHAAVWWLGCGLSLYLRSLHSPATIPPVPRVARATCGRCPAGWGVSRKPTGLSCPPPPSEEGGERPAVTRWASACRLAAGLIARARCARAACLRGRVGAETGPGSATQMCCVVKPRGWVWPPSRVATLPCGRAGGCWPGSSPKWRCGQPRPADAARAQSSPASAAASSSRKCLQRAGPGSHQSSIILWPCLCR